ncbi:MAG: class I SAM-dependent methyltransferase [Candidatus Eremiobacterota bacterium]
MTFKALNLTEELLEYLRVVSLREPAVMRRLREETARMPMAQMQIAPEQGQFMALLVELMGARKALEIGVFTGYSALSVARALPEDGRLVALDVSEEWTSIARSYWNEAGVAHKIELRLAPALESLAALLAEGQADTFDFAFLDADKENYENYYEAALRLLRPGGLLVADNVLYRGGVLDPHNPDRGAQAARRFNQKLLSDERVSLAMLTVADGLTLARKRDRRE